MRVSKNKNNRPLSQYVGNFLSLGLFIYFFYHLMHGDHGYFAQKGIAEKLRVTEAHYQDVKGEREALENRVKMLRPDSIDLDLLDERAREVLGFVKPNEKVIIDSRAG